MGELIFANDFRSGAPGITALVWRETAKMGPSSTSRGWWPRNIDHQNRW